MRSLGGNLMSIAKNLRSAALVATVVLLGGGGCGGARYVMQDASGGVVAIPANSNSWPTHYRDEAEKLMRQKCPDGYVIDREEEVVVGQTTTGSTNTDTRSYDLPGGKRQPSGSVTATTTNRSVSTQDKIEYRITFHAVRAAREATPTRVLVPVSGPAGLPPTPVPVGQ